MRPNGETTGSEFSKKEAFFKSFGRAEKQHSALDNAQKSVDSFVSGSEEAQYRMRDLIWPLGEIQKYLNHESSKADFDRVLELMDRINHVISQKEISIARETYEKHDAEGNMLVGQKETDDDISLTENVYRELYTQLEKYAATAPHYVPALAEKAQIQIEHLLSLMHAPTKMTILKDLADKFGDLYVSVSSKINPSLRIETPLEAPTLAGFTDEPTEQEQQQVESVDREQPMAEAEPELETGPMRGIAETENMPGVRRTELNSLYQEMIKPERANRLVLLDDLKKLARPIFEFHPQFLGDFLSVVDQTKDILSRPGEAYPVSPKEVVILLALYDQLFTMDLNHQIAPSQVEKILADADGFLRLGLIREVQKQPGVNADLSRADLASPILDLARDLEEESELPEPDLGLEVKPKKTGVLAAARRFFTGTELPN